jgi:hypothetical protein
MLNQMTLAEEAAACLWTESLLEARMVTPRATEPAAAGGQLQRQARGGHTDHRANIVYL